MALLTKRGDDGDQARPDTTNPSIQRIRYVTGRRDRITRLGVLRVRELQPVTEVGRLDDVRLSRLGARSKLARLAVPRAPSEAWGDSQKYVHDRQECCQLVLL